MTDFKDIHLSILENTTDFGISILFKRVLIKKKNSHEFFYILLPTDVSIYLKERNYQNGSLNR